MLFIDRLIERIIETKNPSVIGLDTSIGFVPPRIRDACEQELSRAGAGAHLRAAVDAEAIYRFNREIIDAISGIVPAVKPQMAFYELYGQYGAEAFVKTANYARHRGLIVIADAKRGDIGSTAEAYADAFLGPGVKGVEGSEGGEGGESGGLYCCDAMTVNPYLGIDGVKPFIDNCRKYKKGIFVLVKTSNPSSGDFQDLELASGGKVYELIADRVAQWGQGEGLLGAYGYSSICAVVGATYPAQAKELRARAKRVFFLVPGYGAQGGGAEGAAAAFDSAGLGAIVNASRSVLCAWSHERWGGKYAHDDFAAAAEAEALRMKSEINHAINATD
ncbi:MAG: orotidine-5'-phosphate decarboxylase [Oscillospiraceae bacterium]|nr:orotidine-5'-phosphate decarboxylase [Oscillospiraceae bacterium]